MRRTNYGWPQELVTDILKVRCINAQETMNTAKRMMAEDKTYEHIYDRSLAEFTILGALWVNDELLKSRNCMIEGLKKLLNEGFDPSEDAIDPGVYQTHAEIVIQALILEFASLLYRHQDTFPPR